MKRGRVSALVVLPCPGIKTNYINNHGDKRLFKV